MPYIGNTIRAADDYRLIDDISSSFNGSTTSFALQVAGSAPVPFPKSPQQVLISVNGVIQEPDPTGSSGFNLVGTNIVFSSAPTNGHAFFGIIYATADYLNAGGNFPAGSLGAPSITFIGDENTGLYRKGGGSIGFVADATEIANTDSNGLTISSGNLIIPDSIIHNGDSNTKIRFPAVDTASVETSGAEALRIDSSGRLIVGAVSSNNVGNYGGAALQVEGLNAATSAFSIIRHSADVAGSTILLGKTRGTSDGAATIVQNGDRVGSIIGVGGDGNDTVSSLAEIKFEVDGTPGADDMPGRIVFSTTPDGSATYTERLRIAQDGRATFANNVVINGYLEVSNDNLYINDSITHAGDTDTKIRFSAANTVSIETGGSERLKVNATGLGVGTGSDAVDRKLHVKSAGLIAKFESTSETSAIIFATPNNESAGTIPNIGATTNDLTFTTGNLTRITVDVIGRVLIGGSSSVTAWGQQNRLQVQGSNWEEAGGAIIKLGANNNSPNLIFAAGRGTSPGTAVQNSDHLGVISFNADDGTDLTTVGAMIRARIDGTVSSNRVDAHLDFLTHSNGSTTERIRIHPTGEVTIPSGVTLGTAIDSHPASNTLDDYEEGTWTINTDIGSITPQSASYTKIGRSVTVSAYIVCPTSSDGNNFRITSLPFTSLGATNYAVGVAYTQVHTTDNVFVQVNPGNNDLYVYKRVGNSVTFADLSGAYLLFTCTYFTG